MPVGCGISAAAGATLVVAFVVGTGSPVVASLAANLAVVSATIASFLSCWKWILFALSDVPCRNQGSLVRSRRSVDGRLATMVAPQLIVRGISRCRYTVALPTNAATSGLARRILDEAQR